MVRLLGRQGLTRCAIRREELRHPTVNGGRSGRSASIDYPTDIRLERPSEGQLSEGRNYRSWPNAEVAGRGRHRNIGSGSVTFGASH